jgi:hypothetical protein
MPGHELPTHLTVTASGSHVLAFSAASGTLDTFAVDALSGALTLVGSDVLAGNFGAVAFDPRGPYVLGYSTADLRLHGARVDAPLGAFETSASTLSPAAFVGWSAGADALDSWAITAAGDLRHVTFEPLVGFSWSSSVAVGASTGALGVRLRVR